MARAREKARDREKARARDSPQDNLQCRMTAAGLVETPVTGGETVPHSTNNIREAVG